MKNIDMKEAIALCKSAEALSSEEKEILVKKRLCELVFYAKDHSAYFKKLYKNIEKGFAITDLTPVAKTGLMESYEDWVTDPQINFQELMDYIHSDAALTTLYLDKYSAITTSGTTGEPMPMVRDSYHNTIHGALMQTRLLRNVDPNALNPKYHKLGAVIFLNPSVSSYSGFEKMRVANKQYEDNLLAISLEEKLSTIVEKLNQFQPDTLTAYPSVLGALSNEQKMGRLKIHPQVLACSAELLTKPVYNTLRDTFGCVVLNNYCSTEGGEAAMSCECGELHINDDWIIIEPVDKDGNPTKPGEWSDGIYITDLTNYVQPIIRYYMNDKVKISHGCACGSSLPVMNIMGRVGNNITVGGKEIIGINIDYLLTYIEGVYNLQLVQTSDRRFEFRAVFAYGQDKLKIFNEVKDILKKFFDDHECGPVEITLSDQPPKHSERGGKIKRVVKEFD
ncbi:MAG: hypothetical protein RSD88_07925 [Anaerovoracaceae bacterium]